jgi:uncharacterized protein YydD (DUF2326 family)
MVADPSTNIRLDNVERAVGQLADQVSNVAKFMERLVSIEERNGFMTEKVDELKDALKQAVAELNKKNEDTDKKITALKERQIWMAAIYSVFGSVLAMLAPHLLKFIQIGAAQ